MNKRADNNLLLELPRGGVENSPPQDLDRSKVGWDDIRIFGHVADARSFRAAAAQLGSEPKTLRKHVSDLELALGAKLLMTSPDGVHLTELGETVYLEVRRFASSIAQIERKAQCLSPEVRGRVRLSITEGLGTFWVLPRLISFQYANPRLSIDAKCKMELSSTLNLETDVSVQFVRPTAADVITIKLGTLHVLPFASKEYAERFGLPRTVKELAEHKIVLQPGSQLDENAQLRDWGITQLDGVVSFRADSSAALYTLVRKGAGIGALPSYAACLDQDLVPIEIDGLQRKLGIWLAFHPEAKDVPSTAALIQWMRTNFDTVRFPFFRDEYVSPTDLAERSDDDWRINAAHYDWNAKR